MMTRIFRFTLKAGPRRGFAVCEAIALVFREHIRLVVGGLAMALAIAAMCAPPAVKSVARPAFIDAPTNLTVTAASNTSISLSWNASPSSVIYELERSESMSGPFVNAGSTFNQTFVTDNDVDPLRAYVYRVRGTNTVNGQNVYSPASNMALGTAISFEFNQLGGQRVTAQHLYDVRTAINAVRTVANMAVANWARDNLGGLEVKASDVQELRTRLNEALMVLQIPVLPYADQTLSTGANGTPIRAIHLEQLQARSTLGSSDSSGPLYSNNASRAVAGEFGQPIDLPLVPVHLSVLPNRRILFWGRDMVINQIGEVKQAGGHSEAFVWDRASNEPPLAVPNLTTNLFCSGHSFLPDGKLFVTGGHRSAHFDGAGEAHTNIFDYSNNSWTPGPPMDHGRWYPYNVTLGTGEPLIMAGSYWSNEPPPPYDPYNPNIIPPSRDERIFATNLTPQVYTPGPGTLRPLDDALNATLTQYPYVHLTSGGKIFQAQSGFIGTSDVVDQLSRLLDPKAATGSQWSSLPSTLFPHAMGSSVFLGDDKVLLVGGFSNDKVPNRDAEYMTLNPGATLRSATQPMRFPRTYHTATLLPNGKVLVTGGVACTGANNIEAYNPSNLLTCSDGQVLIPELWDPASGQWTMMAPHQEVRAYHSVAALLPDGRVLVGGGGLPGAVGETVNGNLITDIRQDHARLFGHKSVEIFSPPYLFDANGNPAVRPVITFAPPIVSDGEMFFIGTSGAGSQPKVSLVRLPSVTHGFNQDQRVVPLSPSLTSGGLNVTVPASPNRCPPGYYMLFVLNNAGVPSVAEIVKVQNASLFPDDTPADTAGGAGQTWEQGIEFSSLVSGQITHIRFWKALGEPSGGHVGRIWDAATHVQLASAQFFNETASGWQEAQLQTPLSITAGVRYQVTYNINSVVAKTFNALNQPIASWPLIGWGSYYSTPAGTFPTTGTTSNLFADVRFK